MASSYGNLAWEIIFAKTFRTSLSIISVLRARPAAWYAKDQVTFSDALACVRRELWKSISLSIPHRDSRKSTTDLINHFAELLCYAQ